MVADSGDVVGRLVERDETGERLVGEAEIRGVDVLGAEGPLDQPAGLIVANGTQPGGVMAESGESDRDVALGARDRQVHVATHPQGSFGPE